MSIEAIAALGASALGEASPLTAQAGAADNGFAVVLDNLQDLNRQMHANERSIQGLALGETDNLHQIMMNLERTRLEFDLLLQVRNRALEAYQELMRMQI